MTEPMPYGAAAPAPLAPPAVNVLTLTALCLYVVHLSPRSVFHASNHFRIKRIGDVGNYNADRVGLSGL